MDDYKGICDLIHTICQYDDRWNVWKTKITISHKSTFIYHISMYLTLNAYF